MLPLSLQAKIKSTLCLSLGSCAVATAKPLCHSATGGSSDLVQLADAATSAPHRQQPVVLAPAAVDLAAAGKRGSLTTMQASGSTEPPSKPPLGDGGTRRRSAPAAATKFANQLYEHVSY